MTTDGFDTMGRPIEDSGSTGRPRPGRRVATAVLLGLLVLGGRQAWYLSADPTGEKDCSPVAPKLAAGGAGPAGADAADVPWLQKGGGINDVSCLNPTPVTGIVDVRKVEDIQQALRYARANGLHVSIAGARHSQGGHAFAPGVVVLDMRRFNAIAVDEVARIATVQSGATWHDIQNRLHPRFAIKAMQSTDVFTVGGSISVNAHGMDHQAGSVGGSLRAMRVMLPDGTIRTTSRTVEPELFRLVVGGYGLFGIILEAEIEITDNAVYRSARAVLDYQRFPAFFEERILRDSSVRLMYGHLSTSPASFLREMLVYTYTEVDSRPATVPQLGEVSGVRLRRLVFNLSKLGPLAMRLKWWAEKELEHRMETCPIESASGDCLVTRNHPMHDSVPYLMNRLAGETDILHEYFIPRERFVTFVDRLRDISQANRANLLNASVRVVHKEDNFLSYAPVDNMFAVVLYLNQKTDAEGTARMATLTRELIDLTSAVGGRFFLPYQLHYTPEQLRQAYPEIDAFFAAKDVYDPGHLLTNTFHRKYAR